MSKLLSQANKKSMPAKKKAKNGGNSRVPRGARDTFLTNVSGIGSQILKHSLVASGDPLATAIAAQVSPFNIAKGTAKKLTESLQSQAFSARSTSTLSVPSAHTMLFCVGPAIASNNTATSVTSWILPNANMGNSTSTVTSTTVGYSPANTSMNVMVTNTPYNAETLAGSDYTWRMVGGGLRMRNVSEQLYRGGLVRYVLDATGTLNAGINASTTNFEGIKSLIDSAQHSVRKHFSDNSLVEMLIPAAHCGWETTDPTDWSGIFAGAGRAMSGAVTNGNYGGSGSTRYGGTTSLIGGSTAPLVWGYFTNNSTGAQTIDLECVEHWEVHGNAISILHTPSPNHVQTQSLISSVIEHVSTNHSNNPHLHFKDVIKGAVKLLHNKQACKDASVAASIMLAL